MYVDAKKFDYSAFGHPDAASLVERDKSFARETYCKWINENADPIVDRQWEIDDIGAVEQTGEFIKLLREAEFTYALGAYTSAIALVGVCAEDLCQFFADSAGHARDNESQHARIERLRSLGAITRDIAESFHQIRRLRNSCLHYNDGFKQKQSSELRADALQALNSIKAVYAGIVGLVDYGTVDMTKYHEMVTAIANEAASSDPGGLGVDDAVSRMRNLFAQVFGVDLSLGDSSCPTYRTSIFNVLEVVTTSDPAELTLVDLASGAMVVVVDLTAEEAAAIDETSIDEGNLVAASLMSVPNGLGMTGAWRLWAPVRKLA